MRHYILPLLIISVCLTQKLHSQYIVQATPSGGTALQQMSLKSPTITTKTLWEEQSLFLVEGLSTVRDISKLPGIISIEKDERLYNRDTPDDTFYADQYSLSLINVAPLWDAIPNAVDFAGREVVIAILDDGFQIDHPDLAANIYINDGEIPNNGIDDDGNGIIDDYQGWNQNRGDGQHIPKTHGTSVAGIIGAEGNNSEGITGTSWNVKMLPISGIDFKSDIIGALRNIANLRRLWNESNGQEGAYIVVSSYSGGIPQAFPDGLGNTAWCNLYEELGELGVLSIGATVNTESDIDQTGDMPSLCNSKYLIVTTNIDQNAVKVRNAGFSSNSVDLGAPGRDIITCNVGNNYNTFTGTSAATPHVAGVAVQLFCTPCPNFYNTINEDPARSVLDVRSAILNTVVPEASLRGITTSGGRLNAAGAIAAMQTSICGGSRGTITIDIEAIDYDGATLTLEFETPNNDSYTYLVSNMSGQLMETGDVRIPFFGDKILTLEIGDLPFGIYNVTLVGTDEVASTRFFSISR